MTAPADPGQARAHGQTLGFIGLGRMGLPMARNLLRAGYPVVVHSRSPGPVDELVAEGAMAASTPAAVADAADVVFAALPTEEASRAVFLGDRGLVPAVSEGRVLIDLSTVSPELSREIHAAATTRKAAFLDAPVSGGPEGARNATLTIMVGGERAAFDQVEPLLRLLGSTVRHVGPSGAGSVVKLANQLMTAVNGIAVAEGLALGLRHGISPEVLGEVIGASFGDSRMFRRLLPMIAARDFSGGAAIELYVKDLGIVSALAAAAGLRVPVAEAALAALREALQAGLGGRDISAMVTRIEGEPGEG